jgi:endo-1,4-beta-xylanase
MARAAARTLLLALFGAGTLAAGCAEDSQPAAPTFRDVSPLRDAAAVSQRSIGVALSTRYFEQENYRELAAHHFDSVTAENEMKWLLVQPEPEVFAFEAGDEIVRFAEDHGMRVRGHTLVWHSQLPEWAKALPAEELREAMLRHVSATVEHWKGRVAQWDVVNEALANDGTPRSESAFAPLWPSYIDDAFHAAHAADPDALLFYNDFDIEAPSSKKTEATYALVKRLKEAGVPIHGVGLQAHFDPRYMPTAAAVQQTLERFAELDVAIELTELDLPIGSLPGTLEEKLAQQAELTRGIVRACLAVPRCTGITLWGLSDRHSWLRSEHWGKLRGPGPHLPLAFDDNQQPKPMYQALYDTLMSGSAAAAP